jgi:UDP-sugar transporter A1/2/3
MMVDVDNQVLRSSALLALVILVIQNTSLVILLKLTNRKDAELYSSSSVVLVTELLKLSICAFVAACHSKRNLTRALAIRSDQRLLLVPSVLYVIQNNLLFLGAKLLPTLVYVVCTQTKILATAFMSRLLLGTRISNVKYISLFFLGIGIFLVQRTEDKSTSAPQEGKLASEFIGMMAVFLASFTSGTAGIVLEKIYKGNKGPDRHRHGTILDKNDDVKYTVWIRNVQLSLISLPFALFGAVLQLDDSSATRGFMRGFDEFVWGVVICQTAGGIIIAFVMKFANNMLKCLAVAISICLCAIYSVATGSIALTSSLLAGICIVVAAVYVFSTSPNFTALERCSMPK